MHGRGSLSHSLLAALALAAFPFAAPAQTTQLRTEVIQGRATSDGTVPIPIVDVVVTMAPDRTVFQTKTDSSGAYRLVIRNGTGDYLVHLTKIGFTPFRKRITRSGADSVYVVDAKMAPIVQRLDAVQVQAARQKPNRGFGFGPEVGAAEKLTDGVNGALSPDVAGDLTSIASTVPGITAMSGGISAFGLGPAANSVTLNGMSFAGADIPRDAQRNVRVSTSTYDPARGWFSGAQTSVEVDGGNLFTSRRAHVTLDAPQFQYTDPISSRLGQRITNFNASLGTSGSMSDDDKYFYTYAVQGGRSIADAASLVAADPVLLQHAGVSSDSVARLRSLLASAGVPLAGAVTTPDRVNDNISFIARFDHAPYDWQNLKASTTSEALTMYGKLSRAQAVSLSPTTTPGHGGETRQAIGMVQGLYSTYVHDYYLVEGRSAFTFSENKTSPYLSLPDGRVLVTSDFATGTPGFANLQFGGNSSLASDLRQWTWETTASSQAYTYARKPHRLKADADLRLDGFSQSATANQLGTFTFNSLADLQAARPASFSRTLNDPTRTGSEWNGFASLGDMWRVSPTFQMMYGVRVEANRFNDAPDYNPAVESAFHLRTDHAPNTWAVSPRLGFTWLRRPGGNGIMFNPLGQFNLLPTMYIRGGVGLFRSMLPASLLSNAAVFTGLPGGVSRITCLGAAAPAPDWASYAANEASIPTACVAGVPNPVFSDGAPTVQLFDRAYTAPRSWRGNLSVSSSLWKFVYGVDATYSLNNNLASSIDANFRGVPQFTLADEGRPVFVPATAIVPTTGGVSSVLARSDASFGRVVDAVSDLKSRSRQVTLTLSPNFGSFWSFVYVSAGYTLSDVRAQHRGFDGSTFASPTAVEWTRGDFDVRHSLITSFGIYRWGLSVTMLGRLSSGLPFTPLIGSDVNGDGLANDRAFVFDPATAKDANLVREINALRSSAPAAVARCLDQQIGHAASSNSCEGPWTTALNAQISVTGSRLHLPRTVNSISLNLTNPLGGLDQALHGSDHLRGWGTQPFADPVLYTVRGFDANANRFIYEVNPRFGTTTPAQNTLRAPFRLTLDVAMTLGRAATEQQLERWLLPGRAGRPGPKLTSDELVKRYARSVPDPYDPIVREADSLLLTRPQLEAVQEAQRAYQAKRDSHWKVLADYLAALPDHFDVTEAFKRQEDASDAAWAIAWADVRESMQRIMSPVQLTMLPYPASMLWKSVEAPKGIRYIFAR